MKPPSSPLWKQAEASAAFGALIRASTSPDDADKFGQLFHRSPDPFAGGLMSLAAALGETAFIDAVMAIPVPPAHMKRHDAHGYHMGHYATFHGRTDTIDLLLARRVDLSGTDPHQLTLPDYAAAANEREVFNQLRAAGIGLPTPWRKLTAHLKAWATRRPADPLQAALARLDEGQKNTLQGFLAYMGAGPLTLAEPGTKAARERGLEPAHAPWAHIASPPQAAHLPGVHHGLAR